MLKFYHINNKGRGAKSWWILANDKEDAIRIAKTRPGKPDINSLVELPDEDNISKLRSGNQTGTLAKRINVMNIKQVFGLEKENPEPVDPWFIVEKI